jgi:hypothetical protein
MVGAGVDIAVTVVEPAVPPLRREGDALAASSLLKAADRAAADRAAADVSCSMAGGNLGAAKSSTVTSSGRVSVMP